VETMKAGLGRCIGDFHQLLAEILAGKQPHERSWRIFEADRDVLLLHEFASRCQRRLEGLGLTQGIIKPDGSLHAPAPSHKLGVIGRAGLWLRGFVHRDRTAQGDSRIEVDA
jgi:hypothetical protein